MEHPFQENEIRPKYEWVRQFERRVGDVVYQYSFDFVLAEKYQEIPEQSKRRAEIDMVAGVGLDHLLEIAYLRGKEDVDTWVQDMRKHIERQRKECEAMEREIIRLGGVRRTPALA